MNLEGGKGQGKAKGKGTKGNAKGRAKGNAMGKAKGKGKKPPKEKQKQKHSPKAKGKVYRMKMMVVMRVIAIQMKITFLTLRTSQTWAKERAQSKEQPKEHCISSHLMDSLFKNSSLMVLFLNQSSSHSHF